MEDSPIPGQPVRLRSGTFASVKAKIAALLNPTVINLTSLKIGNKIFAATSQWYTAD